MPNGTAGIPLERSNAHDQGCVNELILKFVISAAFTHIDSLYLLPDIMLIGAYI